MSFFQGLFIFRIKTDVLSFFTDVRRLWARTYTPSDQDILRARLRTIGISETIFDVGSLIYRMFDVGGQRSERKKWIHVFDNCQAILFLVAISAYDSVLIEDRNGVRIPFHRVVKLILTLQQNQMEEALMLFENIVNVSIYAMTTSRDLC